MSVVKRALEDYQKALASWRQAAGKFNDSADAYNKSLQMGPDGQPIVVLNTAPYNGMSSPYFSGTPFSGGKPLDLMGRSANELNSAGELAEQWGRDGKVYYTDYRADSYTGKQQGGRDYFYAARTPENIRTLDPNAILTQKSTESESWYERPDGSRFVPPEGQTLMRMEDGRFYLATHSWYPQAAAKPGEFTQAPPKDPGLTLQQIKDLDQPDADQALAVAAMADKKGTVAQRYGGFDNDGEEGLVARAMKGFKKE